MHICKIMSVEFKTVNQRPNRTGFYRFEFGSVRLRFLESSSGSVRFDCISKRSVRVRFGSTVFSKNQFGFGSVRLHFQNISSDSVRFDSAQILCIHNRIKASKIHCVCASETESNRVLPVRVRFGSASFSGI